ncbi:hypothetical protein OSB04_010515 [Centaurea solstitialis]|uniref:Uncharacterized protein n=1 Tax=Centaurea solstitialis TaxID=347529 RepID=A0AA38TKX6_9ASTR|nr:hypothetical protein OSB04_010515 [Centaurea solstitialis]
MDFVGGNFDRFTNWVLLIVLDHGLLLNYLRAMIMIDKKNPIGRPIKVPSHEIHESLSSSISLGCSSDGIKPEILLCDKSKVSTLFMLPKDVGISPEMLLCERLSCFRPLRLPNEAGISPHILLFDKSKKE